MMPSTYAPSPTVLRKRQHEADVRSILRRALRYGRTLLPEHIRDAYGLDADHLRRIVDAEPALAAAVDDGRALTGRSYKSLARDPRRSWA